MIQSKRITHKIAELSNPHTADHVSCNHDTPQYTIMLREDQDSTKKKSAKRNRRSLLSVLFQPMSSQQHRQRRSGASGREQVRSSSKESRSDTDSYETDLAAEKSRQQEAGQEEQRRNELTIDQYHDCPPAELAEQLGKPCKSPLVEEFCLAHKISLSSTQEQPASLSSSSPEVVSLFDSTDAHKASQLSEQDRRLINWRLMAARSMWSASSLPSSDSELEMLDCQSPALVVNCSDDTSCSSVELIWTRPRLPGPELDRRVQNSVAEEHVGDSSAPVSIIKTGLFQRLSIFELARPSRARGRRVGSRQSKLQTQRRSNSINLERSSRDTVTPVQWVANPLFSADEIDTSATSRESLPASDLRSPSTRSRHGRQAGLSSKSLDSASSGFNNPADSLEDEPEPVKRENKKKHSKKRWSSTRSPNKERKSDADGDDNPRRDNIYFNHIMRFDRRIKSNVVSIKSQLSEKLSDTGKRASVLADQLITSIKETTKEQVLAGHKLQRNDSLPNSFASLPKLDSEAKKAKLFSLIYMHQQQQSTGQPVITRQPVSALSDPRMAALCLRRTPEPEPKKQPPRPPPPKMHIQQSSCQRILSLTESDKSRMQPENQKNESSLKSSRSCPTGRVKRRPRASHASGQLTSQAQTGDTSDDEDFYHEEYAKFRGSLDRQPKSRNRRTKLRSLNYWRRYRMRKLGIDWPPAQVSSSRIPSFNDLTTQVQSSKKEETL